MCLGLDVISFLFWRTLVLRHIFRSPGATAGRVFKFKFTSPLFFTCVFVFIWINCLFWYARSGCVEKKVYAVWVWQRGTKVVWQYLGFIKEVNWTFMIYLLLGVVSLCDICNIYRLLQKNQKTYILVSVATYQLFGEHRIQLNAQNDWPKLRK